MHAVPVGLPEDAEPDEKTYIILSSTLRFQSDLFHARFINAGDYTRCWYDRVAQVLQPGGAQGRLRPSGVCRERNIRRQTTFVERMKVKTQLLDYGIPPGRPLHVPWFTEFFRDFVEVDLRDGKKRRIVETAALAKKVGHICRGACQ